MLSSLSTAFPTNLCRRDLSILRAVRTRSSSYSTVRGILSQTLSFSSVSRAADSFVSPCVPINIASKSRDHTRSISRSIASEDMAAPPPPITTTSPECPIGYESQCGTVVAVVVVVVLLFDNKSSYCRYSNRMKQMSSQSLRHKHNILPNNTNPPSFSSCSKANKKIT